MIDQVEKSDGSRQLFNEEKMRASIAAAAKDAGILNGNVIDLIDRISSDVMTAIGERTEISTAELKELIVAKLSQEEPRVAIAWKQYDAQKQKG